MNHLVFTIHENYLTYRMGNQLGSHPIGEDSTQFIIDYLVRMINPKTHEVVSSGKW
jgi:hypothetical protein